MIIRRNRPTTGTFFAIWPRWTPDGWACFEWLHFEWHDSWGWGSSGHYTYRRLDEDRGCWRPRGWHVATPPTPERCKNFRNDGPTPCHYPQCTCPIEGGMTCGGEKAIYG